MKIKGIKILLIIICSLTAFQGFSQTRDITGVVRDENKVPLPGVSVKIKGTQKGTATDFNGKFSISVDGPDAVLIFSYLSFETQALQVKNQKSMSVVMVESTSALDEVVVVGYGTQKKRDIVGAISEKKVEDNITYSNPNIMDNLQGQIPGLNIQPSSNPGSKPSVNIRGFNSINGGSPLILVDGIETSTANVNPNDIKSVSVLKDTEASAIYGSRGAFGVILITTKDGSKQSGINVTYENRFGWKQNTASTDFLTDPYKYAKTIDAAIGAYNGGNYTGYNDKDWEIIKEVANGERKPFHKKQPDGTYKFYYKTDFYDYMFKKTRPEQEHNITVSGGNDTLNGYLSGKLHDATKIQNIQDAERKRYYLTFNLNFKPTKWLKLTARSKMNSESNEEYAGTKNGWGGVYGVSRWRDQFPIFPPTIDGKGVSVGREGKGYVGRIGSLLAGNTFRKWNYENVTYKMEAELTPIENLEIHMDWGYRHKRTDRTFRYAPFEFLSGNTLTERTGGLNRDGEWRWKDHYTTANAYGSYKIDVAHDHHFKLMLGYNQEKFDRDRIGAQIEELYVRDKANLNLGTEYYNMIGSTLNWSTQGYFGRFNYDFKDKYLLEVSARYDGSSRFPKDDRWGFFPSAAVAWRMSKENFWKPIQDVIPSAKVRFSIGTLGNQTVGVDTFRNLVRFGKTGWLNANGDKEHYARVPAPLPKTIGWEKVHSKNLGLDFGFLKNKLNASVDLYEKETTDMYVTGKPLPAVFGAGEPRESFASLRNRGFEVELSYRASFDVLGSPLALNVSANVSNSHAKITKFDNPEGLLSSYYEGQELGEIWGYHADGQFQSDEEAAEYQSQFVNPSSDLKKVYESIFTKTSNQEWKKLRGGDIKYVDANGDGKIDDGNNTLEDHGDKTKVGNSMPKFPFGFHIGMNWKNFDLSVTGQGIGHQDWYPTGPLYWGTYHRPYTSFLRKDLVSQAWTPEKGGKYPRIERGYQALNSERSLYEMNDYYMENVGYLRIKNFTIGYNIPAEILKKISVKKVRLFVSGENLWTWSFGGLSNYIDPVEMGSAIDYNNPGGAGARGNANENEYPMTKTYSVGVQITL